jgi:hypothetical protein
LDRRERMSQAAGENCILRSSIISYGSSNFTRMIVSRKLRWAEHVARKGVLTALTLQNRAIQSEWKPLVRMLEISVFKFNTCLITFAVG